MFGGDEGLRILTHYIGKLNLQVLALEHCQLTDASTPFIASILKVSYNNCPALSAMSIFNFFTTQPTGSAK